MSDRRTFLRQAGGLAALSGRLGNGFSLAQSVEASASTEKAQDQVGFKSHLIWKGDGKGGWTLHPAEVQFLHGGDGRQSYSDYTKGDGTMGYGIAQMDNGEVILLAAYDDGNGPKGENNRSAVAFSRDGGRSWTTLKVIEDVRGRPTLMTYLGKGNIIFETQVAPPIIQVFSSDYGRTWSTRPLQLAPNGKPFNAEGNALVERDEKGVAVKIAEVGGNYEGWPVEPAINFVRWSTDGGRIWNSQSSPEAWYWQEEYQGRTYRRGVSEGSLVRAANGWLIAALRLDMHAEFIPFRNDNLEGLGVSISKDNGTTWLPITRLYESGRQHPHLLRLPNGQIVMTYIVRQDRENLKMASYRRGCEALISNDNGLTWDLTRRYILDAFEVSNGVFWSSHGGESVSFEPAFCGHVSTALLDDGYLLTTYGKYVCKAACVIKWKPGT